MSGERCSEQRDGVLAAATRLMATRGYSGASMRQIAAEAGVSLSMINYYFGSKQALLEGIVDDFHARLLAAMREALESGETLEEKVQAYVRAAVREARKTPHQMRICYTELPEEVPDIVEYKAIRVRRIVELVQEHIAPLLPTSRRGHLHFLGPAMGNAIMSHFMVRPVLEQVAGPLPDDDAFYDHYAETIADLLLNGLAGRRD